MGKAKFNYCAGIFGRLWLAFELLTVELLVISCLDVAFGAVVGAVALINSQDVAQHNLIVRVVGVAAYILKFFIYGSIGGRLLDKNREKAGGTKRKGLHQLEGRLRTHEKAIVFRGAAVVCYLVWLFGGELPLVQKATQWFLYVWF